jgi:hypothetical protein
MQSLARLWHKHSWWVLTLLLSCLLLWLRFYRINTSLLFFNDIGRDFLELWEWEKTGKPPLLGPQTSALPFNQSAVYFYLLMPVYLVANHSLLSTLYACGAVYLGLIWFGAFWLKRYQQRWLGWFFWLVLLLLLQPEMIIQQRFVWNPSFIAGWLGVVLLSGLQLVTTPTHKWRWSWILAWGLALSLAVSFSYSVIPVAVAVLGLSVFWWKKAAGQLWASFVLGGVIWNLPTAFFEVRHSFLLTKMMLFGPWITQIPSTLASRYTDLAHYLVSLPLPWFATTQTLIAITIFSLWIALIVVALIKQWQFWRLSQSWSPLFVWTSCWWLLSLIVTLALPVAVQSHYIFGIVFLGLTSLVLLPHYSKWLLIGMLLFCWVQPSWLAHYWRPARQSLATLESCSQKICQAVTGPVFVSNQASAHPYHNAMEYQYLLRRTGCTVQDLANYPDSAQQMVVVLDDTVYEQGKTAFNELTLFGSSEVSQTIICSPILKAVVLKKVMN